MQEKKSSCPGLQYFSNILDKKGTTIDQDYSSEKYHRTLRQRSFNGVLYLTYM